MFSGAIRASRATPRAAARLGHSATVTAKEPNPGAGEIIMYLREGLGGFVVQMPSGERITPEEIFIPALSCWVRADGSAVCGDMGRGHTYFGPFNRWRIRRAVAVFRRMKERTDRLIEAIGV